VSDQQPGGSTDTGADLQYDLAHEASGVNPPVDRRNQTQQEPAIPAMSTYDGDYSYDLAHDVPRSR
jgi:hypothetical protein